MAGGLSSSFVFEQARTGDIFIPTVKAIMMEIELMLGTPKGKHNIGDVSDVLGCNIRDGKLAMRSNASQSFNGIDGIIDTN